MVKKVIKDNNVLLNEGIFFKSVFLLDKNRVEIGVLETKVALNLAYKEKLDLLCINPKSNPPVCQIIDYNKYLYQKKIKSKSPDKKQNIVKNKEISFRINISNHDLEIKANKVKVFLRKGWRVKINALMRFRNYWEMRKQKMKKPDLEIKARELLDTFFNLVKEHAVIEKEPKILGNFYFMFLKGKKIVKN